MSPGATSTGRDPDRVLDVEDLHAGYGRLPVVRGLSVHVARGEAVALLGPNGHGKTTALRAVVGLGRTTAGRVRLGTRDITGARTPQVVELGLMLVPQGSALFPRLSVQENLVLAGRSARARATRREHLDAVRALFPALDSRRRQLVGTLSGGERQMVAIGMGLMAAPEVLVLDEPTLGLAPKVRHELLQALLRVRESGLSLLVADGDVDFLFGLTDRWHVVELGRVVGSGTAADRPTNEQVMEMYVGAHSGQPPLPGPAGASRA